MWNPRCYVGNKDNFTAQRIAAFICESGRKQTIHRDGETPGRGLRVTSKDTKSYISEHRLYGRTTRVTIGNPAIWPLETQWRKDPDTRSWQMTDVASVQTWSGKMLIPTGTPCRSATRSGDVKLFRWPYTQRSDLLDCPQFWSVSRLGRVSCWKSEANDGTHV